MSTSQASRAAAVAACLSLAFSLAGCGGNVKQDAFNAEVAKLREEMQAGDRQSATRADSTSRALAEQSRALAEQQQRVGAIEKEFETLRNDYKVGMEKVKGQLRFNMPVHFEYDESELREADRPVLDRFAEVVKEYYPGAFVTVEGFADPSGDYDYNLSLGRARAESVRDYLVNTGGLVADSTRAVSYGEVKVRQVVPDAQGPGETGLENRRVTLVIDHASLGPQGVAATPGSR